MLFTTSCRGKRKRVQRVYETASGLRWICEDFQWEISQRHLVCRPFNTARFICDNSAISSTSIHGQYADVSKMYRQIWIDDNQRDLQRIVWRDSSGKSVRDFRLNTVTYDLASSPYQAIRCLQQLAYDIEQVYPQARKDILEDFYVDDLLTGTNSIEMTKQLKADITRILLRGRFELRKWRSNDSACLSDAIHDVAPAVVDIGDETKLLEVGCRPDSDMLQYSISVPDELTGSTKRSVLSLIAQIFDPLGLFGPVIIRAKIMLQHLWQERIDWNGFLPRELQSSWTDYRNRLKHMGIVSAPRHAVCTGPIWIELHGFCDASESAYGACIYLRSTDVTGRHTVRLLCAKSRVAPLKRLSLPRLELCGALLFSRLTQYALQAMNLKINRACHWCDSTITQSWIAGQPHQWVVANRVSEIQRVAECAEWRHVLSDHNAADTISRGVDPSQLQHLQIWWEGPGWLVEEEREWPEVMNLNAESEVLERRREKFVFHLTVEAFNLFNKYSTFSKLRRVVAWMLRLKRNTLKKETRSGQLNVAELQDASTALVRLIQRQEFSRELHNLHKRK